MFCSGEGEIRVDCKKEELKLDSEIKVESDKVVIQVDTFDEEVKIDIQWMGYKSWKQGRRNKSW